MIYSYSALKGGGFTALGSFAVHLSMLFAMWTCLSHITDHDEIIEELIHPKDLFMWCSAIHVSVAIT